MTTLSQRWPAGRPPLIWRIHEQAGFPSVCWEHGVAPGNLDGAMPDENSPAEDTRKLRARFPRWGILFDPLESIWVAVRGNKTLIAASTPETLTERVEAAARGEAGPDEGEKTQAWRARRRPGRALPKIPSALPKIPSGLPARGCPAGPAAAGGRP
jgi:hypothetical protein